MERKNRKAPWMKLLFKLWTKKIQDRRHFCTIAASCGDIVRIPLGFRSTFIMNDPEAISHILVQNESNYVKNSHSNARLEPFIGPGLLTNSGEPWRQTRHEVQRELYYKNITQYVPFITNATQKHLDAWIERTGSSVDLVHEMSKLVFDISAMALFGADVQPKSHNIIPRLHASNKYFVSGLFLKTSIPTLKNLQFRKTKRIIDDLINDLLNTPQSYDHQLTPALKCFRNLPDDSEETKLRHLNEAKHFILAGHETTATALTWTLYLLSKHPEILQQVVSEIDSVFNGHRPTLEKLDQLEYTTMVIEETLRLYPSLWIFDRAAINDDIVCNYHVPAKSVVIICPYTLHRNPKYWSNPDQFDPQRFNKNNQHHHPKNAYIPFGSGPRVCIGKHLGLMIMKIAISMILQQFDLIIDPKLEVEADPLITIKPDGPIPLKIKRRRGQI